MGDQRQFTPTRADSDKTRAALVLIGGGGHAKVLIAIVKKLDTYWIIGYTDQEDRGLVSDVPFVGSDKNLSGLADCGQLAVVLGVGQVGLGEARCELFARIQAPHLHFPAIVSPDAIVNQGVSIGDGTVVMDGAVINSDARIGCGAIVNTNTTIEHDVVLADWVHIGPGAVISGGAAIGRFSMIGAGATVIEGIHIADRCMVGAGAAVVNDLTEPGVYVGSPARRIK